MADTATLARKARDASRKLQQLPSHKRVELLRAVADALERREDEIQAANDEAMARAAATQDVGARLAGGLCVLLAPAAAADTAREENLSRHGSDGFGQCLPTLDRRGDVEDHHLVDSFPVVSPSKGRGVTSSTEVFEVDAFDDRAVPNVQAGDDPLG